MTVIVSHLDTSRLRTMSGRECEIFLTIINKVKLRSVINTYKRPGQDNCRTFSLPDMGNVKAVAIIFY